MSERPAHRKAAFGVAAGFLLGAVLLGLWRRDRSLLVPPLTIALVLAIRGSWLWWCERRESTGDGDA